MSDALITGLAALAGALIGGLTTVLATHLANKGAAKVAREQRDRDWQAQRYEEAKGLISEFLGTWWQIHNQSSLASTSESTIKEFATLGARIGMLIPKLEQAADRAVTEVIEDLDVADDQESAYPMFFKAARNELAKLEPNK